MYTYMYMYVGVGTGQGVYSHGPPTFRLIQHITVTPLFSDKFFITTSTSHSMNCCISHVYSVMWFFVGVAYVGHPLENCFLSLWYIRTCNSFRDSYKGALSEEEMEEVEKAAQEKAHEISILLARENEIKGIRDGTILSTKVISTHTPTHKM